MKARTYNSEEVLGEMGRYVDSHTETLPLLTHMVEWFRKKEAAAYADNLRHFFAQYGPERPQ